MNKKGAPRKFPEGTKVVNINFKVTEPEKISFYNSCQLSGEKPSEVLRDSMKLESKVFNTGWNLTIFNSFMAIEDPVLYKLLKDYSLSPKHIYKLLTECEPFYKRYLKHSKKFFNHK